MSGCAAPVLNRPAPDFEVRLISGGKGKVSNATLKGKPSVINFWASWCGPCGIELPVFDDVATRYRGRVNFLAIATNDSEAAAMRFIQRERINMPIGFEQGDKTAQKFGVSSLPSTVILDERGYVVDRLTGAVSADILIHSMESALRAARLRASDKDKGN